MASRSLGTLTLDVVARIGGLIKGMSQAERETERRSRGMRGHLDKLSFAFRGLVGIAGATALAVSIKRTIELGDEFDKAATKAGLGGQAISELAHVAKTADVELGGLSNALRFMQTNLSEAATGAKAPLQTLKALGLELDSIRTLAADQQFEVIAEQISRLRDPADKARAAVELFGKAGSDLLPLFEKGAEGIRKAREEAQRLGVSFSDQQISALAEADAAIKRMNASWEGLALTLTAKVAPAIATVLEGLQGRRTTEALVSQIEYLQHQMKALEGTTRAGGLRELDRLRGELLQLQNELNPYDDFAARRLRALQGSGTTAPGFAPTEAAENLKSLLEEIQVLGERITVDPMQRMFDELNRETQTSTERILENLADIEAGLNVLFASGRIDAQTYNDRWTEAIEGVLEKIEVTHEKLGHTIKETTEQSSQFLQDFAQNSQGILGDALFGAMEGRIDNIGKTFVRMLNQMVAQALAAQLAQKLFGVDGQGGGLLESAFNVGASLFGGGRANGGPVAAGMLYRVNEGDRMEALSIPGRDDYLMMGNRGGEVVPANRVGGKSIGVTNNYYGPPPDIRTQKQRDMNTAQRMRIAAMRLA